MKYSFDFMLDAAMKNLKKYDGEFYMGVKSTGIFCIPSCRARFPKRKNIDFFSTKEQAKKAGFRGCLRCKSDHYPNTEPEWYETLLEFFHQNIKLKIKIPDIEKATGVNYSTIVNYFKSSHNTTPIQFLRDLKMSIAYEKITNGEDYRNVAFELGYESISGFRDAFSNHFGMTPGAVND